MSRPPDVVFDDAYDAQAWQEIRHWEGRRNNPVGSAVRLAGKPAELVTNLAWRLPIAERGAEKLSDGMREAVRRLGRGLDTQAVLTAVSQQAGRPIGSLEELRRVPLRHLDKTAQGLDRRYIALMSASGGAAGAVSVIPGVGSGLAVGALAADVLASTGALLTAIAQYATHYGRDVSAPAESQFAVGVLSLGAVAREAKAREALLTELHSVSLLLAGGASWAELSRHASVSALQASFERLGPRLTKRKLGQIVPFAGAVLGGTLGAALADATCQAATQQYRRRYLIEKYPGLR